MNNRYIKKTFPKEIVIVLAVILAVCAYFVGGIFKIENGSLTNIGEALGYVISHPFTNWLNPKTPVVFACAFVLFMVIYSHLANYYRNFQQDRLHGTADWADPEALTEEMGDEDPAFNRILTANLQVGLRNNCLSNNNLMIIGGSGSMKTTTVVEQNLLQLKSNYIMLDVKGVTQAKIGNYVQKNGYGIYSLNTKEPLRSDRYNPFVWIESDKDLLLACSALFNSCYTLALKKEDPNTGDPFWPQGCKLYLQALFYYVWLSHKEGYEYLVDEKTGGFTWVDGKKPDIGTINELVRLTSLENDTSGNSSKSILSTIINDLEERRGKFYPPVRDYRALQKGSDKTVQSILVMVNAMFAPLQNPEVQRIFSDNDINIRDIAYGIGGTPEKAGKRVMMFLVVPDSEHEFDFIVTLFYTQLFTLLFRMADVECKSTNGGALPIPLEVWMDEFYAGSKPPEVLEKFGLVRSRNISLIPILQSTAQARDLYGSDKWDIISDNTAAVIFLGCGPTAASTSEDISKLLGQVTADARSDTVSSGMHGNSSRNVSKAAVQMMTPQEIMRKPREDAIVFLEGRNPVYDMKALPFDLKNGKRTVPGVRWLKERYKEVFACGSYEHPVYTEWDAATRRYVTLSDAGDLFFVIDGQDIPKWEELAENRDVPVFKIEQSNGQIVYYLSEKKEINREKISEIADMVFRRECSDVDQLKQIRHAAMADKDMRQDYIDQLLYNCRPRRGWTKKATVGETLDAYYPAMTTQEKELVACFADRCPEPDAVNNFIVLPVSEQISILEEMDRQEGGDTLDIVFIDEDTLTEEEWEEEEDEQKAEG